MKFIVKFQGLKVGVSDLEKGDPPMGVVLGYMEPCCAIENTLGSPVNNQPDIKGWEGLEVHQSDGLKLKCQSTYLEQFDLGAKGRIYQISCLGIDRDSYQKHFQDHITDYENSFK